MPKTGRFIPTAWLIASLTLGSRLLGLLRESVFSYYFATSELMSAFRIAFMAPNLARRLFGEGALSSAMIPVMTESLQTDGESSTRKFVGTLLSALAVILVGLVLALEIGIAVWRWLHDDPALELATVLIPYMVLICLVAVVGGVLNVRGHFATPAAVPMILNLVIIAATLGGSAWMGLSGRELMYVVCGSVLLAGVMQLVAAGFALKAISFFPIFGGIRPDPQVKRVMALMAPMILGLSAMQINSLMDYLIAYFFVTEGDERVGPAVLGYAQYLYQLPLGVFGISIATAIFPVLSKRFAESDREGMARAFERGIRLTLFIGIPASVGMMFVARPLVATLFERGAFESSDTRRVAGALFFYSLGIAAYFAQHIVVRTFYAMHNSKTPARIALTMVCVNFAMNLSLVFVMEERGLALATAVCAAIQVIWLSSLLSRVVPEIVWSGIAAGVVRMVLATVVMSAMLMAANSIFALDGFPDLPRWMRLASMVVIGAGVYALAARLLRIEELGQVLRSRRSGTAGN